ncbi:MAG: hypothetical protein Kow00128_07250 [Deltaproteobacteria bacterium]
MTLAVPKNEMSAIAGMAYAATRAAASSTTRLFLIIPLLEEITTYLPLGKNTSPSDLLISLLHHLLPFERI